MAVSIAEIQNTTCHEEIAVIRLAMGRASMMPSCSPLITVPTACPRDAAGAKCAASGTSSCAPTASRPTPRMPSRNVAAVPEAATTASASAHPSSVAISPRFSSTSPSGTSSSNPPK